MDTDAQQQILIMLIPSPETKRQFKKYIHTYKVCVCDSEGISPSFDLLLMLRMSM